MEEVNKCILNIRTMGKVIEPELWATSHRAKDFQLCFVSDQDIAKLNQYCEVYITAIQFNKRYVYCKNLYYRGKVKCKLGAEWHYFASDLKLAFPEEI